MKIVRSQMEKITIYNDKGHWVGNFALDNTNGEIMIRSAWGNWCFKWGAMGEGVDLKHFIIDCDTDYVSSKLSSPEERRFFFSDRTTREIIKEINESEKEGLLTHKQARDLKEEAEDLDLESIDNEEMFLEKVANSKFLREFYDDLYDSPIVIDYHPRLSSFMKEGWPLLIETIKQELKEYSEELREVA